MIQQTSTNKQKHTQGTFAGSQDTPWKGWSMSRPEDVGSQKKMVVKSQKAPINPTTQPGRHPFQQVPGWGHVYPWGDGKPVDVTHD